MAELSQSLWENDGLADFHEGYDFANPQSNLQDSAETTLILTLASTAAFQRLHDVRFLGALDYSFHAHPNGKNHNVRYTRAQHSFGVAALAQAYLQINPHSIRDRLLCVAAAMLHDIGHPPFSHTIEPLFKEKFGLDHHEASELIILGVLPIGKEVNSILKDFGINPYEVVDILTGDDKKFDDFFSGPINFDTIEGILRTRSYKKNQNLGLSPLRVLIASIKRDLNWSEATVDQFWAAKDEAYNVMIRSPGGVMCDLVFCEVAKKSIHLLNYEDFISTEKKIFKKIPALRDLLDKKVHIEFIRDLIPNELEFKVRTFFVDNSYDFQARLDTSRYRQSRHDARLTIQQISPYASGIKGGYYDFGIFRDQNLF